MKKSRFHGHALDIASARKELGDCLWYIATLASTLEIALDDIAAENTQKLKARYGEEFSEAASINRTK